MSSEYETLLSEIRTIKRDIISIQTAIQNLASKQQLKQLLAIKQQETVEMQQRIEDLEASVRILQGS